MQSHNQRPPHQFSPLLWIVLVLTACGGSHAPVQSFAEQLQRQLERLPVAAGQASVPQPMAGASTALAEWALLNLQRDADQRAQDPLTASAALFERLDPVWGGLLEQQPAQLGQGPAAASLASHLDTQSLALTVFATAYWISGEQRFRNAFEKVDAYVTDWLRRADGGYAAGQGLQPAALRPPLTPADYWQLRREHDRRQLGLPPLGEQATPLSLAGLALSYLLAVDALAETRYQAEALRLTAALLPGESDQITTIASCTYLPRVLQLALVAYGQTASAQWLHRAQWLATRLIDQRSSDPLCITSAAPESVRILSTVELAQALQTLGAIQRDLVWAPLIEPLVQAAARQRLGQQYEVQLAILRRSEQLRDGFVGFAIAGAPEDPRTQALAALVRRSWHPRRIISPVPQTVAAELKLPATPAVYVCSALRCALPVVQSQDLPAAIAQHQHRGQVPLADQLPQFLGQLPQRDP